MQATSTISNIQQELLKLHSSNIAETDLLNIKRYLAKYFATKAINEADQIWDERGYDSETMNKWLDENNTTNDKGDH